MQKIYGYIKRFKNITNYKKLVRPFFKALTRPRYISDLDILGNSGADWPFLRRDVNTNIKMVSIGVGEDISYELKVDKLANCKFFFFDPTERAASYYKVASDQLSGMHQFELKAVIGEDVAASFLLPEIDEHVSVKVTSSDVTGSVELPCISLVQLRDYGVLDGVDYLKMDIEGAEIGVLRSLMQLGLRPRRILVEFHHWVYWDSSIFSVFFIQRELKHYGYEIFYQSANGSEYGFISVN